MRMKDLNNFYSNHVIYSNDLSIREVGYHVQVKYCGVQANG